jgi:hypothetical protein
MIGLAPHIRFGELGEEERAPLAEVRPLAICVDQLVGDADEPADLNPEPALLGRLAYGG